MAKGQKKSNREQKKPKKTDAERLKATQSATALQLAQISAKAPNRKS